ncbi:hypothetical protein [Paludisphaera mucosa]|uniref:Chromosome partition protein Smc n=1 Tax=Paludisphaera mucosa TaxID=3030827 RepID=A0ABT6FKH5_9BACT|nr:hypothetical protein [Paludisphaera mucosa]MDG3008006.1 hypothetical protein [Paludisphaera mucosa]
MSQSETDRRPVRIDVRAATAAAIVFGVLGGGAQTQQAGKPSADGPTREAQAVDRPDRDGDALPRLPAPDRPAAEAPPPPAAKARPKVEAAPAPKAGETPKAAAPKDEPRAPAPDPPAAPKAAADAGLLQPEEIEAIRADAVQRLKALAPADGGDAKADGDPAKIDDKALADLLEDRRRRLDDYDKLAKELAEMTAPENGPDRQLDDAKAQLADVQGRLDQPVGALLPPLFTQKDAVDQAGRAQMQEAIEGLQKDIKAYQDKLATSPPEPEKKAKDAVAGLRTDRDRIAQGIAALKARDASRAAAAAPRTAAERKAFEERGVNLRVEASVEDLRLRVVERKIVRTEKLAEVAGVRRKAWAAHVRLGKKVLEPAQARFRQLAEAAEGDLRRKAEAEQAKAGAARDPIERYRAERLAELLDLEASAIRAEQAVTAGSKPSLEDMRSQANIARANFERIKTLIEGDEDRLGRLDVLSINADYRRLEPERRRIERDERDAVDKRLRDYANMLTSVELSQIEDRLLDQIDLDDLQDKLTPDRHPEAVAIWRELEEKHTAILARRREALEKLVRNEEEILAEIDRRLGTLEDESNFIRTHLFWVRDQDPISPTTVGLAAGEVRRLTRVSIGLAQDAVTPASWKRAAPEFLAASAVVVVLPLGIFRVRRVLKRRLSQALPGSGGLKVDMNPVVRGG